MKIWSEIHQSRVVALHNVPDDFIVVFSPQSFRFAEDITAVSPQPEVGWIKDVETGNYSAPPIAYINPITSKDFFLRLTNTERENFISSIDPKIKQFAYWLSLSGDVNLTDSKIIGSVNYLETAGVIAIGRSAEILVIKEI